MVLEAFKRKIDGQLELLDLKARSEVAQVSRARHPLVIEGDFEAGW